MKQFFLGTSTMSQSIGAFVAVSFVALAAGGAADAREALSSALPHGAAAVLLAQADAGSAGEEKPVDAAPAETETKPDAPKPEAEAKPDTTPKVEEAKPADPAPATDRPATENAGAPAAKERGNDVADTKTPQEIEREWNFGGYGEALVVGRFGAAFRAGYGLDAIGTDKLDERLRRDVRDLQALYGVEETGTFSPEFFTLMLDKPAEYLVPNWDTQGRSRDWMFYKYDDGSCMIWTYGKNVEGRYVNGYVPYLSIRRNKDFKEGNLSFNFVTTEGNDAAGYVLNTDRIVSVRVDEQRYRLAFHESGTQVYLNEDSGGFADARPIKALIKADGDVTVEGFAKLGGPFKVTYSARGFSAMFKKLDRECSNNELSIWLK